MDCISRFNILLLQTVGVLSATGALTAYMHRFSKKPDIRGRLIGGIALLQLEEASLLPSLFEQVVGSASSSQRMGSYQKLR